jgi:tRNA pseudouridine32 synthase/23S rRNA pseudouridine746 synthase
VNAGQTLSFKARPLVAGESAIEALARVSQLPKARIKDAMNKGAVWLRRGKAEKRLRRSTLPLRQGDELSLHYNPAILALHAPEPVLHADEADYSVWYKPAGLLAQGSREGDHCALLRQAELRLQREVFLVHRLDREASGLMLIAHTRKAAAALSALFAAEGTAQRIRKLYRVEVKGELPDSGVLDSTLDGKPALTRFTRLSLDQTTGTSTARVELVTGRKHQIRRHFAAAGTPLLGDPGYGKDNKDPRGLQLQAVELGFLCPITGRERLYRL